MSRIAILLVKFLDGIVLLLFQKCRWLRIMLKCLVMKEFRFRVVNTGAASTSYTQHLSNLQKTFMLICYRKVLGMHYLV